jgi:drug/metabolite transporter (DMT)-like permease
MRKTYPCSQTFSCHTPGVLLGLSAALLAAAIFGCVAVAQAAVIRRRGMFSSPMIGVLLAYLVGWLLHLVAIGELPLYLAQVGVGASLVVTALVAGFVMGEPLSGRHWAAVAAMALGLTLLAVSAGDVGSSEFSTTTTTVLYVLLGTNALLGLLVWRWGGDLSGVVLGILAGTAYGGSPVATRSLVDPTLDVHTIAPALSIGLFGALGFVLYSAAMKRASVTAATAPVVLLSTVIPAVVGLATFGDEVRSGWWPPAVLAFAVSVVAGIVLCGAEARLELLEESIDDVEEPQPS